MANKKNIKVRDLKPSKDAKGGGGGGATTNTGPSMNKGHAKNKKSQVGAMA
jgi:hypothetical protein